MFQEGTVIHGTSLNEDLIPALADALQKLAPYAYNHLLAEYHFDKGFDYSGEDALELRCMLEAALDVNAPPGFWFGPHPGNSSDLGFWSRELQRD